MKSSPTSRLLRQLLFAGVLGWLLGSGALFAAEMPPSPLDKPGWVLTIHDEFDGPELDTAKWLAANHVGSYSEKAGVYSFSDGCIHIRKAGIQSGARTGLHTVNGYLGAKEVPIVKKFGQLYGYYEIRAKTDPSPATHHVAWWVLEFTPEGDELDLFEFPMCNDPHWNPWRGTGGYHNDPNARRTMGFEIPSAWPESHKLIKNYDQVTTKAQRDSEFHIYAFEIHENGVRVFHDGVQIEESVVDWKSRGEIPLVHLLDVYNNWGVNPLDDPVHDFVVDYFRAYRRMTGYEEWVAGRFPAASEGFAGDHAGDGIANGVKYALGLDPLVVSSTSKLPQFVRSDGAFGTTNAEPAGVNGITYGVEVSEDLHSWSPVVDEGSGTTHIFDVSTSGKPRLFLRHIIRLNQQP